MGADSFFRWFGVVGVLRSMSKRGELRRDYRRAKFLLRVVLAQLPQSSEVQELRDLADKYGTIVELDITEIV